MHLADFSDLVLRLNNSAVESSSRVHHNSLIEILSGLVRFDAAWWGWSNLAGGRTTLVSTATFGLSHGFESALRAVAHQDPLIRHGRSVAVYAKSIEASFPGLNKDFRNFLSAFDIGTILNGHCRLAGETDFNFFMSLYRRSGGARFTDEETSDFRVILRHLEQSLSLTLKAELRSLAPPGGEAALLGVNGEIVRATRNFRQALLDEVPTPAEAGALLVGMAGVERTWTGRNITLFSRHHMPGLMLLRLAPADLSSRLSVEERKVAELLLSGLSMRQISDRKEVSVNTIRNQVASIYRKTGASGKLHLARKLGLGGGELL
ncbi:regulatory protein, luxR family [Lutimaribacter pacificus]|uniref:Regulatory protein, luxR family n=1 Tax=Lutimaribacter pacificus TaxID=391948 RepID=A0A1H0ITZ7_9RHOB|nr:helix-turn-helix transcriptional regulator [Lutimaribacter pacificus]SDO34865.1 regulatory protein, luxR family [Lutimaribacter pacificus]SHK17591.1 regulatory protein, luxR family [Lutimaribacter pacificus]